MRLPYRFLTTKFAKSQKGTTLEPIYVRFNQDQVRLKSARVQSSGLYDFGVGSVGLWEINS